MHYVIVLAHNQVSCRHRTLPQSYWRGHGWLVSVTASIVCWGLPVQMRWKRRRCAARMHPTCGHNMPYAFSISGIINERVSYSCCSTSGMHYVIVLAHNQVSCRHRTLPQSYWRGHGWLVSVTASIVCWGLPVQMRWKRRRCAARMHPTCGHNMPYAFSISGIINERVSYSCCSTCNTTKL